MVISGRIQAREIKKIEEQAERTAENQLDHDHSKERHRGQRQHPRNFKREENTKRNRSISEPRSSSIAATKRPKSGGTQQAKPNRANPASPRKGEKHGFRSCASKARETAKPKPPPSSLEGKSRGKSRPLRPPSTKNGLSRGASKLKASGRPNKVVEKVISSSIKGKGNRKVEAPKSKPRVKLKPELRPKPKLKPESKLPPPKGAVRRVVVVYKPSTSFAEVLRKGPPSRQRGAFKLPKSLLPLGVWPSDIPEEFDLPEEWKANTLRRYEQPPSYRKIKANHYPDSSWKGLVPIDEIPLCHCKADTGCDVDCLNRQLLMECAPGRCPTLRGGATHCLNTAIHTKSFPATEIFRTLEGRGWGLRLSEDEGAKAGILLHEYLGEVITTAECRQRLRKLGRKDEGDSNSDFYFASLDGNLVLDGGPMGNEARFANHSCAPNCILQKWSVMGEIRVALVAARNISCGEELTYNYHADTLGGLVERQKCLCREPQCSGFIGGEVVTVEADEWRQRTSKVMNQAKPQLEVVRELFHAGQKLGFGGPDADGGGSHVREMECLSNMLQEGDRLLAELAEVIEGIPPPRAGKNGGKTGRRAGGARECQKTGESGKALGEETSYSTGVRRSSRAGVYDRRRRYGREVDDEDAEEEEFPLEKMDKGKGKAKAGKGKQKEIVPPPPRVVHIARLREVLEKVPPGLQIAEASKAKKTLARAANLSRTVWTLLHAASKHGLQVSVPAKPAPLQSSKAGATSIPGTLSSSSSSTSSVQGRTRGVSTREARGALPVDRGAGRRKGTSRISVGRRVDANIAGKGGQSNFVPGNGSGPLNRGRAELGVAGEALTGSPRSRGRGDCDERTGDVVEMEVVCDASSTDSSHSDPGASLAGVDDIPSSDDVEESLQRLPAISGVATRRSNGKSTRLKGHGSLSAVAEEGHAAVVPVPLSAGEGEEALPPKPRMTQVHLVIRACRAITPVFIPGASELEKLVAPAEAWAEEACGVLRIKVPEPAARSIADSADAHSSTRNKPKDMDGKDYDKGSDEGGGAKGPPVEKEKEKERSKWSKLGLECASMTALEEKLEEVAEFSLTRELREQEMEKERIQKERHEAREERRNAPLERKGSGGRYGRGSGDSCRQQDGIKGGDQGSAISVSEARRSTRCTVKRNAQQNSREGVAATKRSTASVGAGVAASAGGANAQGQDGSTASAELEEDEDALHCLCQLPAGTARFRTLMTCDVCHRWFHPACVRTKELRKRQRKKDQPLVFVCPMCDHAQGSVSNFACPPPPGFYIGRRVHRPGLSELEGLMRHAESLPVDGVDGQAYLGYMVEHVVGWRDRCRAALQDVLEYIRRGNIAGLTRSAMDSGNFVPTTTTMPAAPRHPRNSPPISSVAEDTAYSSSEPESATAAAAAAEATTSSCTTSFVTSSERLPSQGTREAEMVTGDVRPVVPGNAKASFSSGREIGAGAGASPTGTSRGLVLRSVGRDLALEAGLLERLGRLVCEAALIEVVDVHKEDVMIRRALWVLSSSLAFPTTAASLRAGQEAGLLDTLSNRDEEALLSGGRYSASTSRLRPTFETLEASLTEGRTLGFGRGKGKEKHKPRKGSESQQGSGSMGPPLPSMVSTALDSKEARAGSEILETGMRVYACLFDAVGDIIKAVVNAETKLFREARTELPALKAATRWAAVETSWGHARALASELSRLKDNDAGSQSAQSSTGSETSPMAVAEASGRADLARRCVAGGARQEEGRAGAGAQTAGGANPEVYCLCRAGDYGGVMVCCDGCSEWFHAPCVGLTPLAAASLDDYYCLVCCESRPEKYGHYAHRWTTNVAIETAVRRLALKKSSKTPAIAKASGKTNQTLSKDAGGSSSNDHGPEEEEEGNKVAEPANDAAAAMCPKRLRDKTWRVKDLPGAKRARASAWVSSFVKRHYEEKGIPWPIQPPPKDPAETPTETERLEAMDEDLSDRVNVPHEEGGDIEEMGDEVGSESQQGDNSPSSSSKTKPLPSGMAMRKAGGGEMSRSPIGTRYSEARWGGLSSDGGALSAIAMDSGGQDLYSHVHQPRQQQQQQQQALSGGCGTVALPRSPPGPYPYHSGLLSMANMSGHPAVRSPLPP